MGAPPSGGDPGRIVQALGEMAQRAGIHVIAGGMPERSEDPDRPYNTCLVVGPDGQPVADKVSVSQVASHPNEMRYDGIAGEFRWSTL